MKKEIRDQVVKWFEALPEKTQNYYIRKCRHDMDWNDFMEMKFQKQQKLKKMSTNKREESEGLVPDQMSTVVKWYAERFPKAFEAGANKNLMYTWWIQEVVLPWFNSMPKEDREFIPVMYSHDKTCESWEVFLGRLYIQETSDLKEHTVKEESDTKMKEYNGNPGEEYPEEKDTPVEETVQDKIKASARKLYEEDETGNKIVYYYAGGCQGIKLQKEQDRALIQQRDDRIEILELGQKILGRKNELCAEMIQELLDAMLLIKKDWDKTGWGLNRPVKSQCKSAITKAEQFLK